MTVRSAAIVIFGLFSRLVCTVVSHWCMIVVLIVFVVVTSVLDLHKDCTIFGGLFPGSP